MGIVSEAKRFFSVKFNLYLVIGLILLGAALIVPGYVTEPVTSEGITLHYFYLPSCPHCKDQEPIVKALEEELKSGTDDITFLYHDASTPKGSALFYQLATEAGLDTTKLATPTIILKHKYLIGVHTREEIIAAIEECKKLCITETDIISKEEQEISTGFTDFEIPFFGRVDLTNYSLPGLAAILGLIDGFNPCAMWVLVFLIALLMDVKDKKKMWIIVGTFIFASGLLYFLFMTAWLNVFLMLGYIRILTVIIGMIALGGGILSVKEYLTTKGDLECKVETEDSHKKIMQKIQNIVVQPLTIPIILAIFALAFVVNSVEFVCSAAIPAIFTQILVLSNISTIEQYGYILLYVLFFMLDDLIIFSLAVFAVSSDVVQKYSKYCRLIGGIILILLGLMLLFAPNMMI